MGNQTKKYQYTMKGVKWWDKKLLKKILIIGLPLILGSVLFSLTEIVDNISLGIWAPKNSIAIANFAGRLYWIAFLLVCMFPTMFGFLAAQYYGAKQYQKEKQAIANSMLFALIMSIFALIIIHVAGQDILSLFINNDDKYNYYLEKSYEYVKVFSYLIILEAIIVGIERGIIAEGKTKESAIITILSVPLNLLFNFIFMSILQMGAIGCAYSTLVSWGIVSIILILWVIIANKKNKIHFGFNPLIMFKFDKKIILKGLKRYGIGFARIFAELSIVLTMTVFSKNYTNGIIVISIINPFFNFILFVGIGVENIKMHFVGTKLGAGKFKKAYEIDSKINLYTFVFGCINGLLVATFAYPLPLIYIKEATVHKLLATYALIIIAISYPFAILANSFVGSLVVGGKGNEAFIAKSIQPFILEVGLLWILAITTNISFIALYILYRILKSSKVILTYLFWRRKQWITNETGIKQIAIAS